MNFEFVKNLVDEIVCQFAAEDIFAIAERAGVKIVYESWYPVTIGEFDRRTNTIRVNRRALAEKNEMLEKKIVAHELGHFFARDLKLSKQEEEIFAREFAEKLCETAIVFES